MPKRSSNRKGRFKIAPFPHPVTITMAALGILCASGKPATDETMGRQTRLAQAIVGQNVQHSGPGVGTEIVNTGNGTGGEVTVVAPSGTSVIGTRVIQNGPGIGMHVINSGSGTGFKSTVIVGPRE